MHDNALVSWIACPHPKRLEEQLFNTPDLHLPLNTDGNPRNPFGDALRALRADAKRRAKTLPSLPNPGVGGSTIAYRDSK